MGTLVQHNRLRCASATHHRAARRPIDGRITAEFGWTDNVRPAWRFPAAPPCLMVCWNTLPTIMQPSLQFGPNPKVSAVTPPEKRGAVYTRRWVVDLILDLAGYHPET